MTVLDWITAVCSLGAVFFSALALFTAVTGRSTMPRWIQRRAGWISDAEARGVRSAAQRQGDRGSK